MAKRRLAWNTQRFGSALTSATTQVTDLLANLVNLDTLTAIRVVGHLVLVPATVSTNVAGLTRVDLGIGVISQEAFDAPTVPDPNVDGDVPQAGWLYRSSLIILRENTGVTES